MFASPSEHRGPLMSRPQLPRERCAGATGVKIARVVFEVDLERRPAGRIDEAVRESFENIINRPKPKAARWRNALKDREKSTRAQSSRFI